MESYDIDTSKPVVLRNGDLCDWDQHPVQFRFAADRKTAKRLVRNCEGLQFFAPAMEAALTLQKTPALALVDLMHEYERLAVLFNGVDCVIFGYIDGEATAEHLADTADSADTEGQG